MRTASVNISVLVKYKTWSPREIFKLIDKGVIKENEYRKNRQYN